MAKKKRKKKAAKAVKPKKQPRQAPDEIDLIREAIDRELAERDMHRTVFAKEVALLIGCNFEIVMRYLRRETRSSILEIPDACLQVLGMKIVRP